LAVVVTSTPVVYFGQDIVEQVGSRHDK